MEKFIGPLLEHSAGVGTFFYMLEALFHKNFQMSTTSTVRKKIAKYGEPHLHKWGCQQHLAMACRHNCCGQLLQAGVARLMRVWLD